MKKTIVVMPVANEEKTMEQLLDRLLELPQFLVLFVLFFADIIQKKDPSVCEKKAGMPAFAAVVTAFVLLSIVTRLQCEEFEGDKAYYQELTAQWAGDYEEIPERSVVIFSDLDFRSSYYRPDVVSGDIRPEYTWEQLKEIYYGSDFLCIKKEYAKAMLEAGIYEETVSSRLREALETEEGTDPASGSKKLQDDKEYAIISLRFEDK